MTWPLASTFRSRKNYFLACATEIASPLLRRYACRFNPQSPTPPATWRKVLLLGANHIGDLLYRSASLGPLQRGLPQCRFDYAAPSPASEVLAGNPTLHTIHDIETPPAPGSTAFEKLAAEHYDAAICYDTGSYRQWLQLAVQLGIPNRVAYVHKGFSAWVTHPITIHYPQPFPAYFRDLVSQLTGLAPDWSLRPQIFPSEDDRQTADALWHDFRFETNRPVLACFITSRQPSGVWPADRFLQTLREVCSRTPLAPALVLCGTRSDREKLESLGHQLNVPCVILDGRLGLRALMVFLSKCRAVLCTDSGPRHLANAAGVPVVFVRNLSFSATEAGPYADPTEYDFAPPAEFVPPGQQHTVFDQINPGAVATQIELILAG